MLVKILHVVEYDERGWKWWSKDTLSPTWDEIESSIRQLDKFRFPSVWLSLADPIDRKWPDDHCPEFEVMGGQGDYWIACSIEGFEQRRYCVPEQGDGIVDVWTSDQGFMDKNKHICHDLNLLISATAYFCEHGRFAPFIPWE
jgi:hypothetical protein